MRYINLRLTYLLTYLLTDKSPVSVASNISDDVGLTFKTTVSVKWPAQCITSQTAFKDADATATEPGR